MSTSRRTFIKSAAVAGGALSLGAMPSLALGDPRDAGPADRDRRAPVGKAADPLDILIIGGTGFTGPEQVNYALARGHRVTLFNRNKTRPGMFAGKVTELIGDLNSDTSALEGKSFDVVIDNPTTFPAWVRNVAKYMAGHTKHYIFISTMSVYADNSRPDMDESDGLTPMPAGLDPYTLVPDNARKYYGALKTFAEQEVQKHYPGINTIVRPGLIVGPLDRSDRFTYWPYRIDKGGEVLAPGTPDDPAQIIDSRDLAEWMIRMAENREMGTYNACGPDKPMTIAEMLYGIRAVTTAGAQFTWVPADFLQEQKIRGWRDMPVWLPPTGATAGFMRRSNARAVAKGLTFRPLAVTAKDTLDWNRTRPEAELKALAEGAVAGISAEREAEVLAAWKARRGKQG
ncbi:MAG TPA: NAD-dependent epimerase/dehydratase family protein [Gemmatimonadaceae bacterium]|nr:NAD-dependent epimerase/dehydratase family protein [Gemmatimonadaceae bacterium]